MRLYKLLSKMCENNPVNIYACGDYLGQWHRGEGDTMSESLVNKYGNWKVDTISNMVLTNGKPCIQVYLK